jgi:ribulose-5-phosphate 4-epimerase/fuculose-1-phosphate aldolase
MSSAANRVVMNSALKNSVARSRIQGLRLSVIDGARELAELKIIKPGEGNLSARIDTERFVVTPTGSDKSKLEPEELFEVEINSHRIPDGASNESGLHRAIYARFHAVHAVVRAHPVKVRELAEMGVAPDPTKLEGGGTVLDRVSWIEDFAPGSRSLAEEVTKGLSVAPALVFAAHGAITVGATVEQAVIRMVRLERLAVLTRSG